MPPKSTKKPQSVNASIKSTQKRRGRPNKLAALAKTGQSEGQMQLAFTGDGQQLQHRTNGEESSSDQAIPVENAVSGVESMSGNMSTSEEVYREIEPITAA